MRLRPPFLPLGLLAAVVAMAGPAFGDGKPAARIVQSEAATETEEVVRSALAGTVVALLVEPGETVTKGQALAHLDLVAARHTFDTARANFEATGTLNQMEAHYQAAVVSRTEIAESVRKRKVPKSRLEHAIQMENFAKGQHQAQLDLKRVQKIQYEHAEAQYERCFFRAPIDGTVGEVRIAVGQAVGVAAHAFTVSDRDQLSIPVAVPVASAEAALRSGRVPIRPRSDRPVTAWAAVADSSDPPEGKSGKILRLLARKSDLPAAAAVAGMRFDVLIPDDQPQSG